MYRMKERKALFAIFALLLIAINVTYSFYYQFRNPIDGDLVILLYPHKLYENVLKDPFGISVFLHGASYCGTNCYLGHQTLQTWFTSIPTLMRTFLSPLDSVYASAAFFTSLVKLGYIFAFAYAASGQFKFTNRYFQIAAIIGAAALQSGGYSWGMAIVDPMLVIIFGYSYPNLLIFLFFVPFFRFWFHDAPQKFSKMTLLWLSILGAYNGLNGPLSGPLICIWLALFLFSLFIHNYKNTAGEINFFKRLVLSLKRIPLSYIALTAIVVITSIYCYYIGKFNLESLSKQISLAERYKRLPLGVIEYFSVKGVYLIVALCLVNIALMWRNIKDQQTRRIIRFSLAILAFITIYTLALPLGGYRFYRPNIVRRDLYAPVSVCIVLYWIMTTVHVIKMLRPGYKYLYHISLAAVLAHLAVTNFNGVPDNSCEREAIKKIAASKEKIVVLDEQCPVMSWFKITDYKESREVTGMLRRWKVLNEEKYFYQK